MMAPLGQTRVHMPQPPQHARNGSLINPEINGQQLGGFFFQTDRNLQRAFAMHARFDRTHRTHRGAPAAQGAFLFVPHDLPGQIFDA
jgi:hypothetical protein